MAKPTRKWVIGFTAMFAYLLAAQATYAPVLADAIGPAVAVAIAAWLVSLLRPWMAVCAAGFLAVVLTLVGANSEGLTRGVLMFLGLALGLAVAVAILAGWAFDRFFAGQADRDA